jgi:Protein of unknown function (DUF3106)
MRILAAVAALALACAPVYGDKRKPPEPKAARPPAQGNPGLKAAQPPALERLQRLAPHERQKLLERLPPDRAQKLQERLDEYDRMTPQQRQRLNQQYDWFNRLPPEKQENLRKVFQRYNSLPQDRQEAVRQEFNTLHGLSDAERNQRTHSGEFRSRYSQDEQKVLEEMSKSIPE